jgi:hypothetical protein
MMWSRVVPAALALCLVGACTSGSESAQPPPRSTSPTGSPSDTETTDPALAAFYDQQIHWQGCDHGFECAKVRVPINYAAPTGASISLSVVRLRSKGGS